MTACRDFGAPRNASTMRVAVVSIVCDGPDALKRERHCLSVRGVTAVEARQDARAQGWRVGIKDPHGRPPRDFCPDHLHRVPGSTDPSPHEFENEHGVRESCSCPVGRWHDVEGNILPPGPNDPALPIRTQEES